MEKWDWNAISHIAPNLYLSAVTAINDQSLADLGITLIINATKELPMFPPKNSNIQSVRVPVYDNTDANLAPYFEVSQWNLIFRPFIIIISIEFSANL